MTKKLLLTFMVMLCALAAFGTQRSAKDIEKMFKGVTDTEAIMSGISFQEGNLLKAIVLSESTPDLNDVEQQLIKDYAQVVLMCNMKGAPFNCYFVKDEENKRGIVSLDGKVMVPPLSGNICNIPNGKDFGLLLVGELSRPTSIGLLQKWSTLMASKDNEMLGLFSAIIVDADKPTIHSLLPLDKYIFLSLGSKGNGKFDIFTLKIVGDDALWGIVDIKGKQILPNKYTGFSRKSHFLDMNNTGMWGKWVGSTEMDMSEALAYSKDMKAETQRRRMELAGTLNAFGDAMMTTAETIEVVQNAGEADDFDDSSDSKDGKESKSDKNDISNQQSYNADKSTYAKYDSMLAQVFAGNRDASLSEIKQWQKKMKELRTKWEAKGKSFPHSANEGK
ncbi:hypothetical protein [uncultured Bacteroides sp.]|uniref:hypothetical protein n=1 Tax=uncultured Bacteroides sp. TaxID=162156 RepID=UPI0025EEB689|nr:hypothetical protein [uncultured Bacteroides sp.]